MKKLFILFCLVFSASAFANGIDDKCPSLSYGPAPVVKADQYICHTEYAVAYSYTTKNPIYTTEFLAKDHTGALPRTNDFRPDTTIPAQYEATPADYTNSTCNGGRCDRGHMTPDQDFSACAVCVSESFYMSNMVPQNYKNNEVIWKHMEMDIRKYIASHPKGGYVISGPAYENANDPTIGKDHVRVPDHLFKILVDAETGKAIAFYMENKDIPTNELANQVVSIKTIEEKTGITFNSKLDKNSVAKFSDWFK